MDLVEFMHAEHALGRITDEELMAFIRGYMEGVTSCGIYFSYAKATKTRKKELYSLINENSDKVAQNLKIEPQYYYSSGYLGGFMKTMKYLMSLL